MSLSESREGSYAARLLVVSSEMSDFIERLKAALADRYAIEREIGAGGMATVYLAEDLKHHRKMAVKVLRPEFAAVLGAERFLNEIKVAGRGELGPCSVTTR